MDVWHVPWNIKMSPDDPSTFPTYSYVAGYPDPSDAPGPYSGDARNGNFRDDGFHGDNSLHGGTNDDDDNDNDDDDDHGEGNDANHPDRCLHSTDFYLIDGPTRFNDQDSIHVSGILHRDNDPLVPSELTSANGTNA